MSDLLLAVGAVGKTVDEVIHEEAPIWDANRIGTSLRIIFTDGTELSISACGCCDGMWADIGPTTEAIEKDRRDAMWKAHAAALDAEARAKGLL